MKTARAVELFMKSCRARGLSPKTISAYKWALDKLQARCGELPNDPFDLDDFIASVDLASPESRYDLWRFTRRFYRWLESRDLHPNAMKGVEAPRRRKKWPRTLENTEIPRLLAGIPDRRDRAMIALVLDTGIRIGELSSLRWQNVKLGTIHVDGKTGERIVPVSSHVRQLLIGLGDGDHIWIGKKGPLTPSGCNQAIRRVLSRSGYRAPKSGPHMLRHTLGRQYIMSGGDIFSLQRILGHRDVSTTMIYVHMNTNDIEIQHAKYSPLRDIKFEPNHVA